MSLYKKNIRVLLIEPAVQRPTFDRAKPNGNLGPAYIIGALRTHGVEVVPSARKKAAKEITKEILVIFIFFIMDMISLLFYKL